MAHANHGGSAASASNSHANMVPYLHFAGGDFLYFKAWQPTSPGTIAAACLGLVVLSLIERWLAATRGVFAAHWRRNISHHPPHALAYGHRALALAAARDHPARNGSSSPTSDTTSADQPVKTEVEEVDRAPVAGGPRHKMPLIRTRTRSIPPFVWAHDLPRGALFALQSLIGYLLMLAVMTFQAGYIISIVAGLGIGEVFFGRFAPEDHMH